MKIRKIAIPAADVVDGHTVSRSFRFTNLVCRLLFNQGCSLKLNTTLGISLFDDLLVLTCLLKIVHTLAFCLIYI